LKSGSILLDKGQQKEAEGKKELTATVGSQKSKKKFTTGVGGIFLRIRATVTGAYINLRARSRA